MNSRCWSLLDSGGSMRRLSLGTLMPCAPHPHTILVPQALLSFFPILGWSVLTRAVRTWAPVVPINE
jgi:hypothetical protein